MMTLLSKGNCLEADDLPCPSKPVLAYGYTNNDILSGDDDDNDDDSDESVSSYWPQLCVTSNW
jgi:hypothetical protein